MTITERIMAAGRWDLRLSPHTPGEIMRNIKRGDHLVVVPTRIDVDTLGLEGILGAAYWRGVILEVDGSGTEIAGQGISWWLDGGEGVGEKLLEYDPSPRTFAQHLAVLEGVGPPDVLGGLTTEMVGVEPTDTWPTAGETSDNLPEEVLARLRLLADRLGVEWEITPAGVLRWSSAGDPDLFDTQPKRVMFAEGAAGRDVDLMGFDVAPDGIVRKADWHGRAAHAFVRWGFIGSGYAGNDMWRVDGEQIGDIDPDLAERNLNATVFVDGEGITSFADAAVAAAAALRNAEGNHLVEIAARDADCRRWVRPGDRVWVSAAQQGVWDPDAAVWFRGQHWSPSELRVDAITWPVTEQMAVIHLDRATLEATDLSDYFEPESGETRFEVGGQTTAPLGGRSLTVDPPRLSTGGNHYHAGTGLKLVATGNNSYDLTWVQLLRIADAADWWEIGTDPTQLVNISGQTLWVNLSATLHTTAPTTVPSSLSIQAVVASTGWTRPNHFNTIWWADGPAARGFWNQADGIAAGSFASYIHSFGGISGFVQPDQSITAWVGSQRTGGGSVSARVIASLSCIPATRPDTIPDLF